MDLGKEVKGWSIKLIDAEQPVLREYIQDLLNSNIDESDIKQQLCNNHYTYDYHDNAIFNLIFDRPGDLSSYRLNAVYHSKKSELKAIFKKLYESIESIIDHINDEHVDSEENIDTIIKIKNSTVEQILLVLQHTLPDNIRKHLPYEKLLLIAEEILKTYEMHQNFAASSDDVMPIPKW
jgi:hypothetical protein